MYNYISEFNDILTVAILVFVLLLIIQNLFLRRKYKAIFRNKKGASLEDALIEQIQKTKELKIRTDNIIQNIEKIEKNSEKMVQKVNIKRYNPFSDAGSDQSFTVSLLDANNDGVLLTGLHSREDMKVYAKPVKNNESTYKMSDEEKEILNK